MEWTSGATVHAHIAAHSRADARRVVEEYCGRSPSDHEFKGYFSPCWGDVMEGVEPERGLWLQVGHGKPVQVYPASSPTEEASLEPQKEAPEAQAPTDLPNPAFTATVAARWDGALHGCSRLWDGYAMACPVLDSTPLKDADWATLFAYMHRRFGPPHVGGDDYKDLSAGWMLHTPDPEVFLQVSPSLSGAGFSFTPRVATPKDSKARFSEEMNLPEERIMTIKDAYRTVLLDLLRPVGVRDSSINALGEVDDASPLLDYDEETEESLYEVPRHASAGFSIPVGMFGGGDWAMLCSLIRELGDGDMQLGRRKAIERLQAPVLAEVVESPWAVQRLVLLGSSSPADLVERLGLSEETRARFTDEQAALKQEKPPAFVDEMTDPALEQAVGMLDRMGFDGQEIASGVNMLRMRRASDESWAALVAIADADFPDASLPKDPWMLGESLPQIFKAGLREYGREDLAQWVDSTVAMPGGQAALQQIVAHLVHLAQEKKQEAAQ